MEKLIITYAAAEKIRQYTRLCPDEISGIGKVIVDKGNLVVTDVDIFKQVVSGAHSTIAPESLAEFQSDIVKSGGSMKEYVLWWHSHADMAVYFSGTDTDTIENSSEFPYLVSLVVNKKGDAKARIDYYTPIHATQELEVVVEKMDDTVEMDEIRKQMNGLEGKLLDALKSEEDTYEKICQTEIDKKVSRKWGSGTTGVHSEGDAREWERQLRADYWREKVDILGQIQSLEKHPTSANEELLKSKQIELAAHVRYGVAMDYEKKSGLTIKGR